MTPQLQAWLQTGAIVVGALAAAYGEWNRRHLKQLHTQLDGQQTLLVQATKAAGIGEGIEQERQRTEEHLNGAPA